MKDLQRVSSSSVNLHGSVPDFDLFDSRKNDLPSTLKIYDGNGGSSALARFKFLTCRRCSVRRVRIRCLWGLRGVSYLFYPNGKQFFLFKDPWAFLKLHLGLVCSYSFCFSRVNF